MCSATIPQRQYFAQQCFKNGWTESLPEVVHISAAELMPAQVKHEVRTIGANPTLPNCVVGFKL